MQQSLRQSSFLLQIVVITVIICKSILSIDIGETRVHCVRSLLLRKGTWAPDAARRSWYHGVNQKYFCRMTVTARIKTFLICGHRLQNACSQAETRGLEILGSSKSILHTEVEILRLKSRGVTPLPPQKTSLIKDFVTLKVKWTKISTFFYFGSILVKCV